MDKETHNTFTGELKKSSRAVFAVAEWIHHQGNDVMIPRVDCAPTHKDRFKFSDRGDLYVNGNYVIDVKCIRFDFTCLHDWKFKSQFIVCNVSSWDNANVKPNLFMHVNPSMTHATILSPKTKKHWWTGHIKNSKYKDMPVDVYMCHPTLIERWVDIEARV